MYTLIDLKVGPYDTPEKIKEEIERIKALPQDTGTEDSIKQLESWLKN